MYTVNIFILQFFEKLEESNFRKPAAFTKLEGYLDICSKPVLKSSLGYIVYEYIIWLHNRFK